MKNEELIRRLRIERKKFDRSGIYAYTQRTLAYNSNKIEGVFCQVLFPEKSVGIPFFQQGIFPAFSGHYASLRMRACSIR